MCGPLHALAWKSWRTREERWSPPGAKIVPGTGAAGQAGAIILPGGVLTDTKWEHG